MSNIADKKSSKDIKNTKTLKQFIKNGGRTGALSDFNKVLRKSVGIKK